MMDKRKRPLAASEMRAEFGVSVISVSWRGTAGHGFDNPPKVDILYYRNSYKCKIDHKSIASNGGP